MSKQEFKYYLLILSVGALSVFVFFKQTNKKFFYQLNFDQNKVKIIDELGSYQLKINSFMEMSLEGNLINNKKLTPSSQYMFNFKDEDEVYYFSYQKLSSNLKSFKLRQVVWHLAFPAKKSGEIELYEVKLPFKEFPKKRKILYLSTIEDCSIKEGKMFRYLWDKEYSDVKFVGDSRDVSGYNFFNISGNLSYLNEYLYSSDILINILNTESDEAVYINNIKAVLNKVKEYSLNKNIFIVTPIQRKPNQDNQLIKNKLLDLEKNHKQVVIIDLEEFYVLNENIECLNQYKMSNSCIESLISFIRNKMRIELK